jgi:hypothetical protein
MAFHTGWYLVPQNDGCPILEPVCWIQGWDTTKVCIEIRGIPPFAKYAKDPYFLLRGPSQGSGCGFIRKAA